MGLMERNKSEDKFEIVLVRHGESVGNALKGEDAVYTGRWDCDLTEKGREQAKELYGDALLAGAEVCYVSSLKRAINTAKLITDAELIIDSRLQERSLGEFEQKRIVDVMKTPEYARYFTDPKYMEFRSSFSVNAPGGENYADVCKRVRPFLDEVLMSNHHKILIVAHFVVIKCLIKELQGLTEEETLQLKVPNCKPIQLIVDRKR